MSFAEIKIAVAQLSPQELAELAAFIQLQDGLLVPEPEIEMDFAPAARHHPQLAEIDAAIDAGKIAPLP
jgi:hypothetical protein